MLYDSISPKSSRNAHTGEKRIMCRQPCCVYQHMSLRHRLNRAEQHLTRKPGSRGTGWAIDRRLIQYHAQISKWNSLMKKPIPHPRSAPSQQPGYRFLHTDFCVRFSAARSGERIPQSSVHLGSILMIAITTAAIQQKQPYAGHAGGRFRPFLSQPGTTLSSESPRDPPCVGVRPAVSC